jgi:type IV pilus assembly protein PilO
MQGTILMNLILLEIIRQKKILLLFILALIVINVALLVVIASYQEPALVTSRSKWNELRTRVARSGHADALTLYSRGKSDLEKLNTRIPPKREFARLLTELLESASNSGVTMGAISYKPLSIKDEALLSYQLALSVNGDYAAVKSYLSDLLQNPELLVVDGVSFTNSDLFVENVVMNLHVTVYLREGV